MIKILHILAHLLEQNLHRPLFECNYVEAPLISVSVSFLSEVHTPSSPPSATTAAKSLLSERASELLLPVAAFPPSCPQAQGRASAFLFALPACEPQKEVPQVA